VLPALVVTTMYTSPVRPALGSSVRDHLRVLQRIDGLDGRSHAFARGAGGRRCARAARDLRGRFAGRACDLLTWRAALAPHLEAGEAREAKRALPPSAGALAARVAMAWRRHASGGQAPPLYSPAEAPAQPSPAAPPS
jgi:hypothetical protein